MAYIQVEDIEFSYDTVDVLKNISFQVNEGDFMAFIGANGAGKSTLLKLLLGELSPRQGSIQIMGEDISQFKNWHHIGYLPQVMPSLGQGFPANVFEVVSGNLCHEIGLFRRMKKVHKNKVEQALEEVGMRAYAHRLIGQLSGGQRQRVLLARAMVASPKILILDEPTTGVDEQSVLAFYQLLERLNKTRGLTIVMVTHDIRRIHPFITRIACLEDRSLVELTKQQVEYELSHSHTHE